MELGIYEGDTCNRKDCDGVIDSHEAVNCSCHICAPCSACTAQRNFCTKCGWEEADDRPINGYIVNVDPATGNYRTWTKRKLDPSKIDYHIESHTHASQICEGVYPEGTPSAEVLEKVRGTFGGRFEYFRDGKFKYIAYTD